MELYHVLNRGTDKRVIAMDNRDRLRFTTDLYVMNDANVVLNLTRNLNEVGPHSGTREQLVNVHGWCLMGNHYHLLLSNCVESGISRFLQKFNGGYTMYFNKRHNRSGVLYQGKTKRILIKSDAHYNYILPYIHCNPLDLQKTTASWRAQCLVNPARAIEYIQKYRWSSYRNYTGEPEFAEILAGSSLYRDRDSHVKEMKHFLNSLQDAELRSLDLE